MQKYLIHLDSLIMMRIKTWHSNKNCFLFVLSYEFLSIERRVTCFSTHLRAGYVTFHPPTRGLWGHFQTFAMYIISLRTPVTMNSTSVQTPQLFLITSVISQLTQSIIIPCEYLNALTGCQVMSYNPYLQPLFHQRPCQHKVPRWGLIGEMTP